MLVAKVKNWIVRNDKVTHWSICVFIGLSVLFITRSIMLSIASIIIIGVCKELHDKYVKKTFFDWWDIVADMLAIPVVVIVMIIYKYVM